MAKKDAGVIYCRPCEPVLKVGYKGFNQPLVEPGAINVEAILKAIAIALGVYKYQLNSGNRIHTITEARFIAMYLIKNRLKYNHGKIAQIFRKDRTNIYYSLKQYHALSTTDARFKAKVARVTNKLKELTE